MLEKDTLVFSCDVVDDDVVGRMDDLFDLSHEVRLEVFIERSHVTHTHVVRRGNESPDVGCMVDELSSNPATKPARRSAIRFRCIEYSFICFIVL